MVRIRIPPLAKCCPWLSIAEWSQIRNSEIPMDDWLDSHVGGDDVGGLSGSPNRAAVELNDGSAFVLFRPEPGGQSFSLVSALRRESAAGRVGHDSIHVAVSDAMADKQDFTHRGRPSRPRVLR